MNSVNAFVASAALAVMATAWADTPGAGSVIGLATDSEAGSSVASGGAVAARDARVEEVVLYRDLAHVVRRIELPADPDPAASPVTTVVIGLPGRVVPESIRAELDDGGPVQSVLHRVREPALEDAPAIASAIERLAVAEERKAAIAARQQLLEVKGQHLDRLSAFASEATTVDHERGLLQAGEVTELTRFAFDEREEIVAETDRLAREARRLDLERPGLERSLERLIEARREPRHEAVVTLARRPATIRVEYLVAGVGWRPEYHVSAATARDVIEVHYRASIVQQSGESWHDARLTLSPGVAPRRSSAPPLEGFGLDLTREGSPGSAVAAIPAQGALDASQLDEITTPLEPGDEADSRVTPSREALRAINVGRVSIDSRGGRRVVAIERFELAATRRHVASPVTGPEVYRVAEMRNDTGRVLPAGHVVVQFDGQFAGDGWMAGAALGETFELGLGVNPELKASRRLLAREERHEGNRRQVSLRYRLTVDHRGSDPVPLELVERVPWAADGSGVRIAMTTISPDIRPVPETRTVADGTEASTSARGLLRWELELAGRDAARAGPFVLEYELMVEFDRGFRLAPRRSRSKPRSAGARREAGVASLASRWRVATQ